MRRFVLTLVVLLASLSLALARDITTLTGQTYRNVTVTRIDKLGIGITHRDGFAFLDFSILPADIRREFGYTDAAYAAAQAAQTAQKQQQELVAIETQRRLAAEAATRQAELLRQREAAQAAAALAAAQRAAQAPPATIASRDYTSRGYTSRDFGTSRYTPPATTTTIPSPSTRSVSSSGGQCVATTKKGYRCSRSASPGSSTCYQH